MSADEQIPNFRHKYAAEARVLSKIDPEKAIAIIARQWVVIALALALPVSVVCFLTGQASLIPAVSRLPGAELALVIAAHVAAFVVIACKQHALGVLMHDSVHHRLFANRTANEVVSNWLCAFPVGMVTGLYRPGHLAHHILTNKAGDPYWNRLSVDPDYQFPKSKASLWKLLLGDLVGANMRSWWKVVQHWIGFSALFKAQGSSGALPRSQRVQFLAFWTVTVTVVSLINAWPYFLLLWVLPSQTLTLAFMRLRVIAEHNMEPNRPELAVTRHVYGTLIERQTIAPLNINYHIAHHLFPGIPLYNLREMQAILSRDPDYRRHAMVYPTYFGKFSGLISSMLTG